VLAVVHSTLGALATGGPAASAGGAGCHAQPALPADLLQLLLLALAPFTCYVPWSNPALRSAAVRCLQLLDAGGLGSAAETLTAGEIANCRAGCAAASRAADGLLSWCRDAMAAGRWKEPAAFIVRYTAVWVVTRLRFPALSAQRLGHALPVAFRLVDDWEATSVWLGASALAHLLAHAAPTDLRAHAPILFEVTGRAYGCKHPAVLHLLSHASAVLLPAVCGPAPAYAAPVKGAVPQFSGPYDVQLADTLDRLAMAASANTQYALCSGLPATLLQLGPYAARHVTRCAGVLRQAACDGGDARVVAAALHSLACLVAACPERFVVAGDNGAAPEDAAATATATPGMAGDAASRRDAVDAVLSAALTAAGQAAAGLYVLPALDDDGRFSFVPASAGGPCNAAEARRIVVGFAAEVLTLLASTAGVYAAAAVADVAAAVGHDTSAATAVMDLAAQARLAR
jgi:hypothetical protein